MNANVAVQMEVDGLRPGDVDRLRRIVVHRLRWGAGCAGFRAPPAAGSKTNRKAPSSRLAAGVHGHVQPAAGPLTSPASKARARPRAQAVHLHVHGHVHGHRPLATKARRSRRFGALAS